MVSSAELGKVSAMRLLMRLSFALCFFLIATVAARADDPRVLGLMGVFSQACLLTHADPGQVRAWAAARKLPEVTNPQGQQIYIGDGGGTAWFFNVGGTQAVLSTRSSGACAVYGAAADPNLFLVWYNKIVSMEAQGGASVSLVRNDDNPGPFGERIGKVSLIQPSNPEIPAQTLTLITNQQAGGPYQVTMQYALVEAPEQ
jgi:hypothetical protein